jgi:hypothetical protein
LIFECNFVLNEAPADAYITDVAEQTLGPYREEARSTLGTWDQRKLFDVTSPRMKNLNP